MFGIQLTFTVPWSEGGLAMWGGIGRVFWTIIRKGLFSGVPTAWDECSTAWNIYSTAWNIYSTAWNDLETVV